MGDGIEYLKSSKQKFDWIYADPSRRNDTKGKVFLLEDCLPNIDNMYTKNVHAILGMETALKNSIKDLAKDKNYIESLKVYFISELKSLSNEIVFNGLSGDLDKSTYTVLNTRFPVKNDMLLFSLDLAGIAVSGGSACQSGSNAGSHVLNEILDENEQEKTGKQLISFDSNNEKLQSALASVRNELSNCSIKASEEKDKLGQQITLNNELKSNIEKQARSHEKALSNYQATIASHEKLITQLEKNKI